jgi:hypothetical protein
MKFKLQYNEINNKQYNKKEKKLLYKYVTLGHAVKKKKILQENA